MSAAVANALPPSILALFAPRPPIEYKPPILKRKCRPYSSMASLVSEFEDPAATAQLPAAPQPESKEARRERIAKLRAEQAAEKVAAAAESYDPNSDGKIKGDPYKTLFVARTSYDSTEAKIKKEFEHFGPIKRIRLVFNTDTGRPRGYAFIEYEQERDMKTAYKQADGKKIDGRRVLVDVERGRTVRNWKPRRLGGGLGSTRVAKAPKREGGQPSMGTARSVSGERGGGDSYVGDRGGGPAGGPPAYSGGGAAPPAGKLQWATERRDDGGAPRGPVGRGDRPPRDERRDERDRGRDRGRDDRDKREDHSRERRDRDRERDRDRARERGDRDKY